MTEADDLDPRTFESFWQKKPVLILLLLLVGLGVTVLLIQLDVLSWASDQVTDRVGEAHHLHRQISEELDSPPLLEEFHANFLPRYAGVLIQTQRTEDPRIQELVAEAHAQLDDDVLKGLFADLHNALLSDDFPATVATAEAAWNERLRSLEEPYSLIGAIVEEHHQQQYIPETYAIRTTVEVEVDGTRHPVEWRHRLDNFRRAATPGFYHSDLDLAWVRTDRAWITIWNVLTRLLLTDDAFEGFEEDPRFQWRHELHAELRDTLGDDAFDALLRGASHRQQIEDIAHAVASRGQQCRHNFRIITAPWMGFPGQELDRFQAIARTDRLENCPRLTNDEADDLRRLSRRLQSDRPYHQVMPRLLALLLTQKTLFAAVHRHQTLQGHDPTDAEITAYLVGTLEGPAPLLGLFKLCYDHRYGSRDSYRGWLTLLRDAGLSCRGEWPPDLFAELRALGAQRDLLVDTTGFVEDPPTTARIRLRD